MAMDKGLYEAPKGLEELAAFNETPGIEIEIEDPEAVHISMDGLEIDMEPAEPSDEDFDANLAEYIDEKVLASLASDLISDFEEDLASHHSKHCSVLLIPKFSRST